MKIGISYSYDDEEHQIWVQRLADRLKAGGLEILYDRDQRLGTRLPHFMEQMVSQSSRVLIICTPAYKKCVDDRSGGAGYEAHLISGELVSHHGTTKFIPVLRRGSWRDAIPACLSGIRGVDLRNDDDTEYEKLLAELRDGHDVGENASESDSFEWIGRHWNGGAHVRNALSAIRGQGHAYFRVIEMSAAAASYEKHNNDLAKALRQAVIWHGEHPWPISVGLLEYLLKTNAHQEARDPYATKESHPDGISYSLRMDHMQRYEYVEARRDCSLTVVETEDFHWLHRGQLMFDLAIGTTSNALKFWAAYYRTLLGANPVNFSVRWHGLKGLRLTADQRFSESAPTLRASPRLCRHSAPVQSGRLLASPQQAVGWEFDFVKRTTGYLFGQFGFDPSDDLTRTVLTEYHLTLSDPPPPANRT